MQKPSKAEMASTIDSFCPIEDAVPKTVLDRSTLEAWAICPYMASQLELGAVKVVGELAVAGELTHQCFSAATKLWVESNMGVSDRDLVQAIQNAAVDARPDLQPDVIRAASKHMAWEWATYLTRFGHINNILGFDGGEDCGRSGQLSVDVGGAVEFTSELDFLRSANGQAFEDDLKTGWKDWSDDDVRDSFQFQSHAVLVLSNYPEVETLFVRIWNTRRGTKTPWVAFHRADVGRYRARLFSALAVRMQGDTTPWPSTEKCRICPCAIQCPACDDVTRIEPVALGQRFVALEAAYDATKKALEKHVDAHGELVLPSGEVIGRNRPASERKKPLAVYQGVSSDTSES